MSEANIGSSNSGVNWSRVGMIAGGAAVAATVGFAAYYQLKVRVDCINEETL